MYYYNCTNLFLLFLEKNVVTSKHKITYVTPNSGSRSISMRQHWARISSVSSVSSPGWGRAVLSKPQAFSAPLLSCGPQVIYCCSLN